MNDMAAIVEQVGRAVGAAVSRATAPISRQIEELMAWKASIGEVRNGKDGLPGRDGKDGSDGLNGKDGAPGERGERGEPGANGKDGSPGVAGKDGSPGRDAPPVDLDAVVAKVLPLIRVPQDGRDGAKGADGINGRDGKDGKDGRDGERGEKGLDGAAGKNGNGINRFDYDEKANTLDIVMDSGEQFALRLPTPARGEKGDAGANGKDGLPGRDGKDGADGLNGKDGLPGRDGKDGADGLNGKDGAPGLRGEKGDPPSQEEVASAITKACEAVLPAMVSKHIESLMPEIVTKASLLVPAGRDGLPGRPGTPGEPGRDGVSVAGIELRQIDKRTHMLIWKSSDGGHYEMPVKLGPMLQDAGVHRPGASYEAGDCVTHGGSYWVAKADTRETPGKSDDWRMVVKRGRDGRDAPGAEE